MIYFLFAISLLLYIGLRLTKAYFDYLEIEYVSKEKIVKPIFTFSKVLKALSHSSLGIKDINWKLNHKREHKWVFGIIKGLCQFFAVFTITSFIFSVLQFWIDTTTDIELAKATILQIEQTQHKIKAAINIFKFGDSIKILVIFLLIMCASFFPLFERFKLKDKFVKFNKGVKLILLFFTVSTSFTFFGNRITSTENGRLGKLEFHRLQIIENNKLLINEVRNKVTEIVINEILSNDDIKEVLDKKDEIQSKVESVTESEEYKEFSAVAPEQLVNKLKVNTFRNTNNLNFQKDLSYNVNKYYSTSKSASRANDSNIYDTFKSKNKEWSESGHSTSKTQSAKERFKRASSTSKSKYSKYYNKYKEPIDIILKNGYGKTGKQWISGLLDFLKDDIPFLDNFIDPIIHEPIEDFITQKTESIFKKAFIGTEESIKQDIKTCADEFSNTFTKQTSNNLKLKALKAELTIEAKRINSISNNTFAQINNYNRKVNNYLVTLSSKSRWEGIRKDFRKRINYSNLGFDNSQIETYKSVLDDWESYKNKNKFKWYNNKNITLEEQFYNYSKSNSKLKACWGFILQQQDWDGAVYYYSYIAPDASARGNPYYLLKYYYNSIGKGNHLESLYDIKTDEWVGIQCPPH